MLKAVRYGVMAFGVAVLVGSVSALFLTSLDWITHVREGHGWIIVFLPLAGLGVGFVYYYYGEKVVKGNALLIEEYREPKKVVPLRMAPFVFFGTLVTHLFGGSAGREGTAVQMGGAIADQFTHYFKLQADERRMLIVMGMSAGFASVFGTPLAGAVFAIEILAVGMVGYGALLPSLLAAFSANWVCSAWGVVHTHYTIGIVPDLHTVGIIGAITAGVFFGGAAYLFIRIQHFWSVFFERILTYPPFRPMVGGAVIAVVIGLTGVTRYCGLGIPVIVGAFHETMFSYDWLVKILFTTFTIGAGFKGGEATPLFFIGATLGNILSGFIQLPMGLLAGMGFTAVFAGVTKAPLACTLMAIELFGVESGGYMALACGVAYVCVGRKK